MDTASRDRFILRAATIEERLSDLFETLPGQKADAADAGRRLAAWCRASASGDWELFGRRLARDGLSLDRVMPRLATMRLRSNAEVPQWASDAVWIMSALASGSNAATLDRLSKVGDPVAFEHILAAVVPEAEARLLEGLTTCSVQAVNESAIAGLCHSLVSELSDLCAPALHQRFRKSIAMNRRMDLEASTPGASADEELPSGSAYANFVDQIRHGGLQELFDEKPVQLRLVAVVIRQWIESCRELFTRLGDDLSAVRSWLCGSLSTDAAAVVTRIEGDLSDRHNEGRSVKLLLFSDGTRVLYKPKDLSLDAEWERLVAKLNDLHPPIVLRAVRVLARDGYGWTEYIDSPECANQSEFAEFFLRAGAWLCLFHLFVATDMHEQNMIAMGAHPVPIDLEMLLQSLPRADADSPPETQAATLAGQKIIESVSMTGLLPTCWRTPENRLVGSGGLNNIRAVYTEVAWQHVNTDAMSPTIRDKPNSGVRNLPRHNSEEPIVGDYLDDLVAGFREYADFLRAVRATGPDSWLYQGFEGLPTRRVMKNTRFYFLLLERLKDERNMADGAVWSADLDFVARFSDWSRESDPLWQISRSERRSLATLCVPHFVTPTDRDEIGDSFGLVTTPGGESGISRARKRAASFDESEIPWQIEVIRLSTQSIARATPTSALPRNPLGEHRAAKEAMTTESALSCFGDAASAMSRFLVQRAVRRGSGASWIGLDWLGHSGLCRPTALGDDLYSGTPGVCLFLAAQSKVAPSDGDARDLALAGLTAVRHNLRGGNAARYARGLGLGGATGLGSLIFALVSIHHLIGDSSLLDDARIAADLVTDDVLGGDRALDVFDGSAGGILGLLALAEATGESRVLSTAVRCGEHILRQPRVGEPGCRSWLGLTVAERAPDRLARPLNGMSHGAAGFSYALAALAGASSREDFWQAAKECIAFENATYSDERENWPDFRLRGSEANPAWLCQWCHGAAGIGLARIGLLRRSGRAFETATTDLRRAVRGARRAWPYPGDNLCCGSLGNIEFLTEAAKFLGDPALKAEAARRLAARLSAARVGDDYVFDGLDRRFDLGLFRGIAGVGYACLRQISSEVPSVLTLETAQSSTTPLTSCNTSACGGGTR